MFAIQLRVAFCAIVICLFFAGNAQSGNSTRNSTRNTVEWGAFQTESTAGGMYVHIPLVPKTIDDFNHWFREAKRRIERRTTMISDRDPTRVSFDNTAVSFDRVDEARSEALAMITLVSALNQNTPLFEAAHEATKALNLQNLQSWQNERLRRKLATVADMQDLTTQQKVLVDRLLVNFEKIGSIKEFVDSSKMAGLWQRLWEKEDEFQKNLLKPVDDVRLTEGELAGVSAMAREQLGRAGTHYLVSPKSSIHTNIIFTECTVKATRDKVTRATRLAGVPENYDVLIRMLALRREIAKLLGFRSWSEYQLESYSIKPAVVARELSQVFKRTRADFERTHFDGRKPPGYTDGDSYYDDYQATARALPANVEQYFPLPGVTERLLDFFSELYSVEIVRIANAPSWHESVQFFGVTDSTTKKTLGVFAIDPHAREGKDAWFWSHDLIYGRAEPRRKLESRPFTIINANFPVAVGDKPPLLQVSDVAVLAHELGHVFHSLFQRAAYHGLVSSGGPLEELREMPSTYVELLVGQPAILRRLSGHWQTGDRLALETLQKWTEARRAISTRSHRVRTLYSLLDLHAHRATLPNLQKLERKLAADNLFVLEPDTSLVASFDYLIGGYDSLHWTYQWSEAIARRLVQKTAVREDGGVDSEFGMHVRRALLEADASTTTSNVLANLLGEKPKLCAWLLAPGN